MEPVAKRTHGTQRGFSILEVLCVVAITLVLMLLAGTAFNAISRSTHLSTASALVAAQINLARQLAMTHNRIAEARFYLDDTETDSPMVTAVRVLVDMEADGSFNSGGAGSRIERFPSHVAVAPSRELSSAFAIAIEGSEDIPGQGSTSYLAIRFRPDGSPLPAADPPTTGNWGLLVAPVTDLARSAALPKNFVMLSINPTTGRTRSFQP